MSYNIYKPFWKLRDMRNSIQITNQNNFTTHKPESAKLRYNTFITTLKYLSIWGDVGHFLPKPTIITNHAQKVLYYMKPKAVMDRPGIFDQITGNNLHWMVILVLIIPPATTQKDTSSRIIPDFQAQ